ncbi:MAG: hypothetical protein FWH43_03520 [Endomicrobia bacterium]|nr:hypothetical protein [Endomicrobiia bacterium]
MKKITLFSLFVCLFVCVGCGKDSRGKKRLVQEDKITVKTNLDDYNYTYSLSNPPQDDPILAAGIIRLGVTVIKDGSGVQLDSSDIKWTPTGDNVGTFSPVPSGTGAGAVLYPTTSGTLVVKATYLDGTIDEMSDTVTIHIIP